jgi:transcriptional regulator with XRE-family HTH domain
MLTKKAEAKTEAKTMVGNFQELVNRIKGTETFDKEVARGEVSDLIDSLMKQEDVKKAELARRLGKSRAYVTKILQGNANFTLDTLVQIARALGYKFQPAFVAKEAEWESAPEIHLFAKAARTTPDMALNSDDYVRVQVNAEGSNNEEINKRITG